MKTLVGRLCALSILAVAVCGCSAGYIYERYGAASMSIVTVGCHTSYDVYESYRDRTLLVRNNVQGTIAGAICTNDLPPGAPPEARLQRAAEEHFLNTKRPKCRITEARTLSPLHTEFSYVCPP